MCVCVSTRRRLFCSQKNGIQCCIKLSCKHYFFTYLDFIMIHSIIIISFIEKEIITLKSP